LEADLLMQIAQVRRTFALMSPAASASKPALFASAQRLRWSGHSSA
jgi:hypothetical protein